ncbi:MAG: hypothetical protein R3B59_02835 [Dehalococcoidia bacterium]
MGTHLARIQLNIDPQNSAFYRGLFGLLGWPVIYEGDGFFGFGGAGRDSIWFHKASASTNDYDGPGMNHIGIGTDAPADVDLVGAWLRGQGVDLLFETPRRRPEFVNDDDETYYQIIFESPDRLQFEILYSGPTVDE